MSMIFNNLRVIKCFVGSSLWQEPSLVYLSAVLLSISLYFNCLASFVVVFVWVVLIWKTPYIKKFMISFSLMILGLYVVMGPQFKGEQSGIAIVKFDDVKFVRSNFGQSWVYKGTLYRFKGDSGKTYRLLPFTLYWPKGSTRPLANGVYQVRGILKKNEAYGFRLKVNKAATFNKKYSIPSLVELRMHLKKQFKKWIRRHVRMKNAQTFLIGISTGDLQDNFLSFTFSRFGLNHILAISGFHFAILTLFVSFLVRPLPERLRLILIGITITLFYLFVGLGPSLERAWLVAMFYLWATFKRELVSPLNILSVAMILILIGNPHMLMHLGFQFSFMITYAILLFTSPCLKLLKRLIKPQKKWQLWLATLLALNLSVHLAAVPICLYHFHKFYLMGLLFNLFIPMLVTVIMIGFMSALVLYPLIHKLALWLLLGSAYLSQKMIEAIYWMPHTVDYCIRVPWFPKSLMVLYVFGFALAGIWVTQKDKTKRHARLHTSWALG